MTETWHIDQVDALRAQLADAEARCVREHTLTVAKYQGQLAAANALLERLEWSEHDATGRPYCPLCGGLKQDGHVPTGRCELGAHLRAALEAK